MSGKFKWHSTRPGRGNVDARIGAEWSRGPSDEGGLDDRYPSKEPSPEAKKIKLTTVVAIRIKDGRKRQKSTAALTKSELDEKRRLKQVRRACVERNGEITARNAMRRRLSK